MLTPVTCMQIHLSSPCPNFPWPSLIACYHSGFLHSSLQKQLGIDSLCWFSERRSRTPHLWGCAPGGYDPQIRTRSRFLYTAPIGIPSFIILCLLVWQLSCWQTNTHRGRWNISAPLFTMPRRWIITTSLHRAFVVYSMSLDPYNKSTFCSSVQVVGSWQNSNSSSRLLAWRPVYVVLTLSLRAVIPFTADPVKALHFAILV